MVLHFNCYCKLIHSGKVVFLICTESKSKGKHTCGFLINASAEIILRGLKKGQSSAQIVNRLIQIGASSKVKAREDLNQYICILKKYQIVCDNKFHRETMRVPQN